MNQRNKYFLSWIKPDILECEVKWSLGSITTNKPSGDDGILQVRILEWVAFPFSRGSSQPRDQTQVSHIAGRLFTS